MKQLHSEFAPSSPPRSDACTQSSSSSPSHARHALPPTTPTPPTDRLRAWIRAREAEASNAQHADLPALIYSTNPKKRKRGESRKESRAKEIYATPPPSSPSTPSSSLKDSSKPASRDTTNPLHAGRDLQPPLRHPREFLLAHGKLGQDQPPHRKIQLRLKYSETPIVDLLYGPALQISYEKKQITINHIVRAVRLRKKVSAMVS